MNNLTDTDDAPEAVMSTTPARSGEAVQHVSANLMSVSGGLANVTEEIKALQWSAAQAFDNLKFMDQKAAVLAASVGVSGAKLLDVSTAKWTMLEPGVRVLCGLGGLLLLTSLGFCLSVFLPRGRQYNSASMARYLIYVDADAAAARTRADDNGRLVIDHSSVDVFPDLRSPSEEWLEAYFALIRNRGRNAAMKGHHFRLALFTLFGAVMLTAIGVIVQLLTEPHS